MQILDYFMQLENYTMQREHTKSISLHGATLDVGNQGCRALTFSLVTLIKKNISDVNIILLDSTRNSGKKIITILGEHITVEVVNYRLSPFSKLSDHIFIIFFLAIVYSLLPISRLRNFIIRKSPCLKAIKDSEFIGDIRGGDSFSDIYGLKRMIIGSIIPVCVILMKKQLVLLPQTYGPYRHYISRVIARYLLEHASKIMTRDYQGIDYINELIPSNKQSVPIVFCPDVAFILEKETSMNVSISPPLDTRNNHYLIGINISGLLYNGGYTGKNMFDLKFNYKSMIHDLIALILDTTEVKVLLIPHVFSEGVENDQNACIEVLQNMNNKYSGRLHSINSYYDQNQIKGIIGMCHFFFGSRMHSCIAAMSQNIPCVGIAYSRKFLGVFESVGLESFVIDGRSDYEQRVTERCIDLIRQRDVAKELLNIKIPAIQEQLYNQFNDILKEINQ